MKNQALFALVLFTIASCSPDFSVDKRDGYGPPVIYLQVDPSIGDSSTWFNFSAAETYDADGLSGTLRFRWDLNNDGIWDTPYTINSDWVHVFPNPGSYKIRLEVKDRYEQISTDSVEIESYGSLKELSNFQDERDGQWYKTVKIGELIWMAENLNYGTMIPVVDTVKDNNIIEKYCYMNDPTRKNEKGGYYTYYDWMEMMNYDTTSTVGICPEGWEVPNQDDWKTIIEYPNRPLYFFSTGGYSNLNLTVTGFPVRWKSWVQGLPISLQKSWTYFTSSFYFGYLNGPGKVIPFIATSEANRTRGNIYSIAYSNSEIRKYRGIAPVRCIKRD